MIYNSVIIGSVFALLQRLKAAYGGSITAKLLKNMYLGTKSIFANSSIWSFIKRGDFFSRVWEYSGVYKIFSWAMNVLPVFLRRLYFKFEDIFSDSLIVGLLKDMLRRFEVLVALCLVIAVIVPHEPWSDKYSIILVVFLAFMYFMKAIFYRYEGFDLKAIDFALFIFSVLVVLSSATSVFPGESIKFLLLYFTSFLLVLVIVSSIKTERSLGLFLDIFLIGVTISGLYGIWQAKVVGIPVNPAYTDIITNSNATGRVFSTMGNPNNYAEILVLTIPFYLAVIFNSKTFVKRIVFALLALPPMLALIWTGSRSAWISFAVSVLILTFFKNKKLIPLLILIGLMCIPVLPQSVYRRIMSLSNFSADTSAQYRILIYKTVWPMLKDYWVTGVGLGTDAFMKICDNYYQFTKKTPPHSHNIFLQIWLELGFMGVLSFVWFIVRMIKKSVINIFSKTDKYINNILIAGISAIAGILVMGIAEYVWYYPRVMLIFWMVVGIILAGLSIANGRREGFSQKNV